MMTRRLQVLLAAAAATAFAFAIGSAFGADNQQTYLLRGLQLHDPSLFQRDWFVSTTPSYHPLFDRLAAAMLAAPRPETLFVVACYVANALVALAWGWLCGAAARHRREQWLMYLTTLAVMVATRTESVMVSYQVDDYLQPSSFGALATVVALALLVRGAVFGSGLALAASGVHANYLALGIPSLGLAQALVGEPRLLSRLLRQLLAPALVALALGAMIFDVGVRHTDVTQAILFDVRASHHYRPRLRDFHQFAGWGLVGLTLLLTHRPERVHERRLATVWASMLLVVGGATVLSTIVVVPTVVQLYAWRFAPISVALTAVIVGRSVAHFLETRDAPLLALGAAMLAFGALGDFSRSEVALFTVVAASLAAGGTLRWLAARRPHIPVRADDVAVWLLAILLAGLSAEGVADARARQAARQSRQQLDGQLFEWARSATPRDALFLTPPTLSAFRLEARRAVVVDWKSAPLDPRGLLEWYERISAVSGVAVTSDTDLDAAYQALDDDRLAALLQQYRCDYVVVPSTLAGMAMHFGNRAFENGKFTVVEVKPAQTSPKRSGPI